MEKRHSFVKIFHQFRSKYRKSKVEERANEFYFRNLHYCCSFGTSQIVCMGARDNLFFKTKDPIINIRKYTHIYLNIVTMCIFIKNWLAQHAVDVHFITSIWQIKICRFRCYYLYSSLFDVIALSNARI